MLKKERREGGGVDFFRGSEKNGEEKLGVMNGYPMRAFLSSGIIKDLSSWKRVERKSPGP